MGGCGINQCMLTAKIKVFFGDWVTQAHCTALLVGQLFSWLYPAFKLSSSDSLVLHFNIQFGVDFIGSHLTFYMMPMTAVIFGIINIVLAYFFSVKDRSYAPIFFGATVLIQLLSMASVGVLVYLNG